MVKHHCLKVRYCLPLFWKLKCYNIKAALAHHPVIQKEVNGQLVKGATEPSTVGTDFVAETKHINLFIKDKLLQPPY